MNNIFDIQRFGKVLVNDLKTKYKTKFFTITGIALYPFIFVLLSLFNWDMFILGAELRQVFTMFIGAFSILLAPFVLYGNVNKKKRGTDYIMLPASAFEKYLSMLIMCIVVTPVTTVGACYLVDTVAATIFPNILPGYSVNNISIEWYVVLVVALYSSVSILGNLVFRKHKIIATTCIGFLSAIILFSVALTGMYHYILNSEMELENGAIVTLKEIVKEYNANNRQGNVCKNVSTDTTNCQAISDSTGIEDCCSSVPVSIAQGNKHVTNIKVKINDKYEMRIVEDADNAGNNAIYIVNGDKWDILAKGSSIFLAEKYWKVPYALFKIIFYIIIPAALFILGFIRLKRVQL